MPSRGGRNGRKEVTVFPVGEVHFALYLQHLGETVRSKSAVEEAVNAIGWLHQMHDCVIEPMLVYMYICGAPPFPPWSNIVALELALGKCTTRRSPRITLDLGTETELYSVHKHDRKSIMCNEYD